MYLLSQLFKIVNEHFVNSNSSWTQFNLKSQNKTVMLAPDSEVKLKKNTSEYTGKRCSQSFVWIAYLVTKNS
jgi:hypothetical protein